MNRPKKNRVYEDWFTPRDFYGNASMIARDYCKAHPDADKNTVYYAASEAAEMYDLSPELRKRKFRNFVYFRITNELYMKARKDKEMAMTAELKSSIIKDYTEGATAKQIAERYGIGVSTTYKNLEAWAKKGLLTLRTPQKPVHVPKKEEPAAEDAAASSDSEVKITDGNGKNELSSDIIPHEEEESQPPSKPYKGNADDEHAPFFLEEPKLKTPYITLSAFQIEGALAEGKECYYLDRELIDVCSLNNMTAQDFSKILVAAKQDVSPEPRFIFWSKEADR